ncbi:MULTISPECIES: type IV toxin-antitoxin system AbiEi family antitoxin [unclassified Thiomonas]|uniref:type IV toxin-antitoxin system AbiEi family antitoxin domain-containing protein n=1 Tax=unclassified Thiomonas TaxID=2625466 RepID=UPI0015622467|nr:MULTISPECIES: type IV toxin-antitoxin system AbiEi family antitoxin [unclassified Thiomonas]
MAYWLADYCRLRQKPYYVGLLSAAALHGSAQQAVQLTQVMTTTPTRALEVGGVHVEFHVKQRLLDTPLTPIKGLAAPLAVSSPEATALDLLAFQHCVGGVALAAEVVAGLLPVMTAVGWRSALSSAPVPVRQRTGYVLDTLGAHRFAKLVQASLPSKLRPVLLQSATPSLGTGGQLPWQVDDNAGLKGALN